MKLRQLLLVREAVAEEVFAANFKGDPPKPLVRGLFNVGTFKGIDSRKLSKSESEKYLERIRIHELADLTLLLRKCSHDTERDAELREIRATFEKLPADVQKEALDHEIAAIETIKDYEDTKGGWTWFCSLMNENVRENRYSDYLRTLPPLEMAIVRWDMSRLPLVRVMLHVKNRTLKNYDRIVWNCDFYDKNKRPMGSTLVVTENVPKNSEGRPSQTIYQKWLFDHSECVLVRADLLPWER